MKKRFLFAVMALAGSLLSAQVTNPVITSFLQNTTQTGSYYLQGNSTPNSTNILVNCQMVEFSADSVYVHTTGYPAYPVGPYLDGNTNLAGDQNAIYRLPLVPQEETGPKTATRPANNGIFINGVSVFDYQDGVRWNPATNDICGNLPGMTACPGGPMTTFDWNRDAIPAEMSGFDCAKGHPAGNNYHHHQNPSAFKLDKVVVSNICNLYDADGLYAIDSTQHSPLIGFAYDGFPIYGAYGYQNDDGTGGIVRIKSGYQLRNITKREFAPDGTDVPDGPDVDNTYFLGYFREDYEWLDHPGEDDYLDIHNGRFAVTPEYPNGIYAYYATVDENWNSVYPYMIGPTFYGKVSGGEQGSVNVPTTVYNTSTDLDQSLLGELHINLFPNPTVDVIAIQTNGLLRTNLKLELLDLTGRVLQKAQIEAGSTVAYFDTQTLYNGTYLIRISNGAEVEVRKVVVAR